jgi:hypothetical protein
MCQGLRHATKMVKIWLQELMRIFTVDLIGNVMSDD